MVAVPPPDTGGTTWLLLALPFTANIEAPFFLSSFFFSHAVNATALRTTREKIKNVRVVKFFFVFISSNFCFTKGYIIHSSE
jgi:hypothetical protein